MAENLARFARRGMEIHVTELEVALPKNDHDEAMLQRQAEVYRRVMKVLLAEPAVVAAASKHNRSPAQVVLRWHLQLGVLPIPKSATPSRRRENLELAGFALDEADMAAINALSRPDGRLFVNFNHTGSIYVFDTQSPAGDSR